MNDSRFLDLTMIALRLAFGGMMLFQHGLPKLELLFWGDPSSFGDPIGLGPVASLGLAVFAEFFCALLLILGLAARLAVVPLICTMVVAVFISKGGAPIGEKELGLLYLFAFIAILIGGSGYYSLDRMLKRSY
ncbi:MAG: DoxX family membrane protein [Lewinellaceae bacterium]|nr:DoxX family membrane protein [Lewinellaceae bacterium]